MSQQTAQSENNEKPRPGKRRWLRRLVWLSLLVTALFLALQGPILRYALKKSLTSAFTNANLHGHFIVEGSLLSGIQINALTLSGKGTIRELRADSLAVDYHLLRLIHGQIDSLQGDNIHVWIDIAAKSPQKPTPPENSDSSPIDPDKIRLMVLPVNISLTRCSVKITRASDSLWEARNIRFTHSPGEDDFSLILGQFTDSRKNKLNDFPTTLTWKPGLTSITQFPIQSDIILSHTQCQWLNTQPNHIQTSIQFHDSLINAGIDQLKHARIHLDSGAINLAIISPLLGLDNKLGGNISRLDVDVRDVSASPDSMQADIHIEGSHLRWQHLSLDTTHIKTSLKNAHLALISDTNIPGGAINTLNLNATIASNKWPSCWHNLKANAQLTIPNPGEIARWLGEPTPPEGWPTGSLTIHTAASMQGSKLDTATSKIVWNSPKWSDMHWKYLHASSRWNPRNQQVSISLDASQLAGGKVLAQGSFNPSNKQYQGSLSITGLDLTQFRPVLRLSKQPSPHGGKLDLSWHGSGSLSDPLSHQGQISTQVKGLKIDSETEPTTDIQLSAEYSENLTINLHELLITRDKLHLSLTGNWKNNHLHIPSIELRDSTSLLVNGHLSLPLSNTLTDTDSFFNQPGNLDIQLHTHNLPFSKIYQLLHTPSPNKFSGTLNTSLTLAGTLRNPVLNLQSSAQNIQVTDNHQIPPSDLTIHLTSKHKQLQLTGLIQPKGHQPIELNAQMPFHPQQWANKPQTLTREPINALLDTHSINLTPYASLLPHITEIKGTFSTKVKLTGTIDSPVIHGTTRLKVAHALPDLPSIPTIKNLDLRVQFDEKQIIIAPSSCQAAGGKVNLSGTIGISDPSNPKLNISLTADKALIMRDDSIILRADGHLNLAGEWKKAHLSGDIGIVESMFYKDIQIIPLGAINGNDLSSSQPEKAALPSFTEPDTEKINKPSVPAPFDQWTLNLSIHTKEKFLIRGNLAKGYVVGKLAIKGTIANPLPVGKFTVNHLQATLPFSSLHINKGTITFTPKTGFDPLLNLKALSKIGSHEITITIYGTASSPQHLLTSSPPLPETEIYFLLATGSTSSNITNSQAATGKAWQLLLDTWIRSSPGKNKRLKSIARKLNQKVNVNISATNPFTGKTFNSATVKLKKRWYLMASIDLENNTRGVILYTIRFR